MGKKYNFIWVLVFLSLLSCGKNNISQKEFEKLAEKEAIPSNFIKAMLFVQNRWDGGSEESHLHNTFGHFSLPNFEGCMRFKEAGYMQNKNPKSLSFQEEYKAVLKILNQLARQRDEALKKQIPFNKDDPRYWYEIGAALYCMGPEASKIFIEDISFYLAKGVVSSGFDGKTWEIKGLGNKFFLPRNLPVYNLSSYNRFPGSNYSPAHTSNYSSSRSGNGINYIIIHTVQGSYAGCISWFKNSKANVSAHFVVRSRDGQITQMLPLTASGWHAGNSLYNKKSIGIEHEGYIQNSKWYTDAMYRESAKLTRWLANRFGIPKTRKNIIGHVEVPRATHTDPGKYWDWSKYMALVNGNTSSPTPAPSSPSSTPSSSPSSSKGYLKGIVYSGSNMKAALKNASVRIIEKNLSLKSGSNGAFSFYLSPGNYTIKVDLPGYQSYSGKRQIKSGQTIWGSVSLKKINSVGILRGVVYEGSNSNQRVPNAKLTILHKNQSQNSSSSGAFLFNLPAGTYSLKVEASGYHTYQGVRAVKAGKTVWGSVSLKKRTNSTASNKPNTSNKPSTKTQPNNKKASPTNTTSNSQPRSGQPGSTSTKPSSTGAGHSMSPGNPSSTAVEEKTKDPGCDLKIKAQRQKLKHRSFWILFLTTLIVLRRRELLKV